MKTEPTAPVERNHHHEMSIPAGCIVCGGDLAVRISNGKATTLCTSCHWLSRPLMQRQDDALKFVHPAGGVA